MPVSKRTRYEVLKRDNHTCRYCGGTAPDVALTIDHVTPVALGGSDAPGNLVAACAACNAGKASTSPDAPLVADVAQTDLRWSRAMKEAAEIRLAQRQRIIEYVAAFDEVWAYRTPADYRSSLEAMFASGLTAVEMIDAAYIATCVRYPDDRFRYFCGVAWRKVGELQDLAKALIECDEIEDGSA